jgi:phage terminase large subunit-like protein
MLPPAGATETARRHPTVEEAPDHEQLTDELLAEADAESDLVDADIEEFESPTPVVERRAIRAELAPAERAEAEAESDLLDADIEDA